MTTSSRLRGPNTTVVDLAGKMVLPGLIDSHAHPTDACMTEFDHPVPEMETIADVLDYIRARAERSDRASGWSSARSSSPGSRSSAIRPATSSTGPRRRTRSCSRPAPTPRSTRWRSKLSGIDKDFQVDGPGKVEKDPRTGEPTGILRNCTRYVKVVAAGRQADGAGPASGGCSSFSTTTTRSGSRRSSTATPRPPAIDRYQRLHDAGA